MENFFLTFSLALLSTVVLCLVRVVKGPGILNRIIGVNVIGTKTMSLILLMGFIFGKVEFFIDIALVYALINFVGTLALSKYFEQRGVLRKESTR